MKIVSSGEVEECVEETRLQAALNDPGKTVVDVMLSKGLMRPDEVDFVRASLVPDEYPTHVGGFDLIERVGEGSMGIVYKAHQTSMDRVVALKILSPRLARSERYVARFQREARAAARLNHPNIVAGIDVGAFQGYHYFAMELIDGLTVQEVLDQKGTIPEKRALEICAQMADALSHAWDKGLVHRDVKPGNIVITSDGTAKITDFGLAKYTLDDEIALTDTGTTLGTAYYVSPEQARGESTIDTRSDIYALGATLFHMLTGQPPYLGTPVSVMTQHVSSPIPDPKMLKKDLSEGVCDIINMMMAKDRRDRYRTPDELALDVRRMLDGKKPLLARTDPRLAILSDAARWEDDAVPEMVSHDRLRYLKRQIGWGHGRVPLGLKILIFLLASLSVILAVLYFMERMKR